MSNDTKYKNDGYQPQERGYQPKSGVNNGYQPGKQVTQPAPPPKKP
ncbi:hypothetical protein [Pantoea stewartii]|nr:hypothetical protein [Pantoea stewartii]